MSVHRIRLAGPWLRENGDLAQWSGAGPLPRPVHKGQGGPGDTGTRCQLPFVAAQSPATSAGHLQVTSGCLGASSSCPDDDGSGVVLIRRFHQPNGLSAATRVFLEMTADRANLNAMLNGESVVTQAEPVAADPTGRQFPKLVTAPGWYRIRAEISDRLTGFNCLAVELGRDPAGALATCLVSVFLEIQEADLKLQTEPPEQQI